MLANPGGVLKPGMFATVEFGGAAGKPAVLVPAEAVIRTGKRSVVIVDAGDGKFAPVEVEVARESGDLAEVRKGLDAGQKVVVSGQFLVDSEASLKGVLARIAAGAQEGGTMVAEGAAADPHAAMRWPPRRPRRRCTRRKAWCAPCGDEVLIKHGAIPTAGMGAMTMAFKAPKGGVPKDVTEGTKRSASSSCSRPGRHAAHVDRAAGARRRREPPSDRRAHPLVDRQPVPGPAGGGLPVRRRRVGGAHDAARRDPRPLRHAGDHPHDVSRARRRRSSRTRSPIR